VRKWEAGNNILEKKWLSKVMSKYVGMTRWEGGNGIGFGFFEAVGHNFLARDWPEDKELGKRKNWGTLGRNYG